MSALSPLINALRTEGTALKRQGDINPAHKGLLYAMGCAKIEAADRLASEEKALSARVFPIRTPPPRSSER